MSIADARSRDALADQSDLKRLTDMLDEWLVPYMIASENGITARVDLVNVNYDGVRLHFTDDGRFDRFEGLA